MSTYQGALNAARKAAKARGIWCYVVIEFMADEYGPAEYDTASDYDLETFHAGATVVAEVGPDGSVISQGC